MRNKQPKKKCWLFDKTITKRSNENEIKSLVEKMGGVQRFTFEPLIPTSRKSISKFLDIAKEEFSDYLDYLELFGGETGFIKEFKLTPYSDLPEYCYPDDDIPVGDNIERSGGDLGFFMVKI